MANKPATRARITSRRDVDPGSPPPIPPPTHGKIRVMTTGVFDLIHLGHVHMLEEAKKHGDELVVIIARDRTVRKLKHEPLNGEETRRRIVSALKPVDYAALGHTGDIYRVVGEVQPAVIALGYDQRFDPADVKKKCLDHGVNVRVVRLPEFDPDLDATRRIIDRIAQRIHDRNLYQQTEEAA